jgi:hypothetical protein
VGQYHQDRLYIEEGKEEAQNLKIAVEVEVVAVLELWHQQQNKNSKRSRLSIRGLLLIT